MSRMHSLGLLLFLFAAGTDTVIQQRWHMSPTARAAWARLHVALELGPGGHLELERVDHGAEPFAIEFWSRSPVPSEPESRTTNPNPWICVGARCCCIANPAPPPRAAGGSAWQQFVVAFGQSTSQPSPRLMAIDGSTHTNQSCVACTAAHAHSRGTGRAVIGSARSGRALLRFVRWWRALPSERQLVHLFQRGFALGPSDLDTSGLRLMLPLLGTYADVFGGPSATVRGSGAWKQQRMQPATLSSPPQQQKLLLVDGSASQPLHLVAHSFSSEYDPLFLIYLDWILHVLLARLHRPVLWTIARCRCTDAESAELRASPYCCSLDGLLVRNHSLLLVNAHSTPRLDFASLSTMLRRRNTRDVGVLHLNHERPWARAPLTAAAGSASTRCSSPANVTPRDVYPPTLRDEYRNFNYALRSYFYEPFVGFAQYVPLGPAKLRPDVPVGGIGDADAGVLLCPAGRDSAPLQAPYTLPIIASASHCFGNCVSIIWFPHTVRYAHHLILM